MTRLTFIVSTTNLVEGMKSEVSSPKIVRPSIEWPTVVVFLLSLLAMFASVFLYRVFGLSAYPVVFVLSAAGIYFSFTLGHEGVHRSISRYRWFNDLLGMYAGLLFHVPFQVFEIIHMRHHAFVNQPDKDPDMHCQGQMNVRNVFRWLFTAYYYLRYLKRQALMRPKVMTSLLLHCGLYGAIYVFAWKNGFLADLILVWTLPLFAALAFTIFIFDYLPHYPHRDTGKYTNSQIYNHRWMAWLTFMHAYHLVHHLWPTVPWYLYRKVYREKRAELLAAGMKEESIFRTIKVALRD